MAGQRWTSVCNSVQKFANNLSNTDFIAGIVFNTQARLLLNEQLIANLKKESNRALTNGGRQPTAEEIAAARRKLKICCSCCCTLIIAIVLLVVFLTR